MPKPPIPRPPPIPQPPSTPAVPPSLRQLRTAPPIYWIVGGSTTQVYSSVTGTFIPVTDPTYVAYLAGGGVPTNIDTIANLGTVLLGRNLTPVDATVLDGFQNAQLSAIDKVILKVLFRHENALRTGSLSGQPTITAQQFLTVIKGLL